MSSPNTVVKRDTSGNIHIRTALSFDSTPDVQDGILFLSNTGDGFTWEETNNNSRRWQMHSQKTLSIEEGVWTPMFTATGGGSIANISASQGTYQRVGKFVTATCRYIADDGIAVPFNGELQLKGLPYENKGFHTSINIGTAKGLNTLSSDRQVGSYLRPNVDYITFCSFNVNSSNSILIMTNTNLNNASDVDIVISVTYKVA